MSVVFTFFTDAFSWVKENLLAEASRGWGLQGAPPPEVMDWIAF
jgi:hypothetical protein